MDSDSDQRRGKLGLELRAYSERLAAFIAAQPAKTVLSVLRVAIPILLIAYLAYRLTQLGWANVWTSRPASLAFYVMLFVQVLILPIGETIIYGRMWNGGRWLGLTVFLRKQYLNTVMLEYSGEAYLFAWAKRKLHLESKILLHGIKDSNVLSAAASLALIWPMIVALVALGGLDLHALSPGYFWPLAGALIVPLILGLALVVGGRSVSMLSRSQMAVTFSVHLVRSLAQQVAEFGLWWFSGALPSATACLQFVVLQLLITRLPLVPNKNLIFVGAGIAVAGLIKAPAAPIAAVLMIKPAFALLAAIVVIGVPWLFDRTLFRAEPDPATS